MWADSLFIAERNHLLRLAIWGAACVLAGTALLILVFFRRGGRWPLLSHFSIQTAAWGAAWMAMAAWGLRSLAYRDLDSYTRLDRALWMGVGLDVGLAAMGTTLALAGWWMGRRMGAVGAGLAILIQGLALLTIHSTLLGILTRLTVG